MMLQDIAGTPVLVCPTDGPIIAGDRDATDLIGEALSHGAHWVLLPVERLPEDFFRLETGIAGAIVQKFVTYRIGLAVIGDISHHTATSKSLRDFVTESNRGTQTLFLPTPPTHLP